MMTTPALRRKGRPHDLRFAPEKSGYIQPRPGNLHDLTLQEGKINDRLVYLEIVDPFGDRAVVSRSTRNDPLGELHSRGTIPDCDYAAGRRWQDAYENSQIGSVRAIDPSKEAVDGGRMPEMLTERQRRGAIEVNAARAVLGPVGNALIQDVLGEGLNIKQAATKRGLSAETDRRFLGGRFRECLSTLAVLFGLAMRPKRVSR